MNPDGPGGLAGGTGSGLPDEQEHVTTDHPFTPDTPTQRAGWSWPQWLLLGLFVVALGFLALKALGVFLLANGSFEPTEVKVGSCIQVSEGAEVRAADCGDTDADFSVIAKVKTVGSCPADAPAYFRVSGDVVCVRPVLTR